MIRNSSNQSYFYKITNKTNGMFYYGSGMYDEYTGSGRLLKEEQNKIGFDKFEYEVLRWFDTREEAFAFENRFLTLYKISSIPNSYNLTSHARGGNQGEEANIKRSLTLKKIRQEKPITGLNNPRADRNLYEFYNIRTNEYKTSTVHDMNRLNEARASMFGYIVRGSRRIYKGWILAENIEKWGTVEKLKEDIYRKKYNRPNGKYNK